MKAERDAAAGGVEGNVLGAGRPVPGERPVVEGHVVGDSVDAASLERRAVL
jgi:hypothetical protein